MPSSISRRSAVGALGVGVLAGTLIQRGDDQAVETVATVGAADALGPIQVGTRFARWTVVAVDPIVDGALALTVAGEDGHQFRLELLARDASPLAPRPPAETDHLAIYVSNGGDGWLPTMEEQGLAAMTLADVLRLRGIDAPIDGLLTHAAHVAAHREAVESCKPQV